MGEGHNQMALGNKKKNTVTEVFFFKYCGVRKEEAGLLVKRLLLQ